MLVGKLHVGHKGERQADCQHQGRRAELAALGASCAHTAKGAMEHSGAVWPDTGGWDALAVLGRLGHRPPRPAKHDKTDCRTVTTGPAKRLKACRK